MKKWLLLLPFLFLPFMGHAQVVGPGFVDYVTSAPSGSCSSNAHQRNVMGLGTVYTCQSGTWAQISGGGGGCAQGTCVVNAPTFDQTITGAHALILSDAGSTFWEKNAVGIGSSAVPGSTSSFFTPVFPTILDAETSYTSSSLPSGTSAAVFAAYLNQTSDVPNLQNTTWTEMSTLGSSSANFTTLVDTYTEFDHNGSGNVVFINVTGSEGDNDGAGTIGELRSYEAGVQIFGSGTITTGIGYHAFVDLSGGSGNITNGYGVQIESPLFDGGAGTINHFHAIHINDPTGGGAQNPDPWALFVAGGKNNLGPQATTVGSLLTSTNCADQHSPAVCGTAASGAVAVPTGVNPTLVINTTKVTATSRIFLGIDETLTIPSTTCNTTLSTLVQPVVTARTAATSFTIQIGATLAANPACVSYFIVN